MGDGRGTGTPWCPIPVEELRVLFLVLVSALTCGIRQIASGSWLALGRFCQNFDVTLCAPFGGHRIDQPCQGRHMDYSGIFFAAAKPAVEVPEISALGHITATLTLDVFADFVFDSIQNTVWMLAFKLQRESFSHGR